MQQNGTHDSYINDEMQYSQNPGFENRYQTGYQNNPSSQNFNNPSRQPYGGSGSFEPNLSKNLSSTGNYNDSLHPGNHHLRNQWDQSAQSHAVYSSGHTYGGGYGDQFNSPQQGSGGYRNSGPQYGGYGGQHFGQQGMRSDNPSRESYYAHTGYGHPGRQNFSNPQYHGGYSGQYGFNQQQGNFYGQQGSPFNGGLMAATGGTQTDLYNYNNSMSENGFQSRDGRYHHDVDYDQWRKEQMHLLDRDYYEWRQDRYKDFSKNFGEWRRNRQQSDLSVSKADASTMNPETPHSAMGDTRAPGNYSSITSNKNISETSPSKTSK